jgi:hypothetical protein
MAPGFLHLITPAEGNELFLTLIAFFFTPPPTTPTRLVEVVEASSSSVVDFRAGDCLLDRVRPLEGLDCGGLLSTTVESSSLLARWQEGPNDLLRVLVTPLVGHVSRKGARFRALPLAVIMVSQPSLAAFRAGLKTFSPFFAREEEEEDDALQEELLFFRSLLDTVSSLLLEGRPLLLEVGDPVDLREQALRELDLLLLPLFDTSAGATFFVLRELDLLLLPLLLFETSSGSPLFFPLLVVLSLRFELLDRFFLLGTTSSSSLFCSVFGVALSTAVFFKAVLPPRLDRLFARPRDFTWTLI